MLTLQEVSCHAERSQDQTPSGTVESQKISKRIDQKIIKVNKTPPGTVESGDVSRRSANQMDLSVSYRESKMTHLLKD